MTYGMEARQALIEEIEILEELKRREDSKTVVGFVCPQEGFTHALIKINGEWVETDKEPKVYLPAKLEAVLKSKKRFIVVYGGRGSGKSVGVGDIEIIEVHDHRAKVFFLREYQTSIKDSVHSLIKEEIKRLEFIDFDALDNSIRFRGEDSFRFAGLARNVDSIKSSHGFQKYVVEEAQFLSEDSLKALTPTARKKPVAGLPTQLEEVVEDNNVSITFIANPMSSADPFSKRFITPFKKELDKYGIYEDELHLIVKMNYNDNPWFGQSGLEEERAWDYDHLPRAAYDHIWGGEFNDEVEDSIILAEWFDACIDAHKKIQGWEPRGVKVVAHDPADQGEDPQGLAARHGTIVTHADENDKHDINEGCDWATDHAVEFGADHYIYDSTGLGLGLRRQVNDNLTGKKMAIHEFNGASEVLRPNQEYQKPEAEKKNPEEEKAKTNKQTFKNLRSQTYWNVRDRMFNTYLAIEKGAYTDPDDMLSLSSDIPYLDKLRSELCRIPSKPNGSGLKQIMTKPEMRKLKIKSPNMGDCVMMLFGFEIKHTPGAVKLNFRRAS